MTGRRAKSPVRSATEARTGIIAIILVSSLVFLLLQARKDVQSSLAIHEARLAAQFASVEAQPEIALLKTVLDDPGRAAPSDRDDRLSPLPGQVTIALPVGSGEGREPTLALLGVQASLAQNTQGHFVIRNGSLFASMRNHEFVVMTSAPIFSLADGLFGRIAIDIGCVVFLGSLMLLIRESRLSDYSVRRLLDASPVPLVVLDAEGRAEFANAPATELFSGGTPDSLGGVQQALRRHDELFDWLLAARGAEGEVETREFEVARQTPPARRLLVSRQSLVVRSRRMTIASAVDITVRHEAEMTLVRAKNAAEELGRLKSESLAMISHELRTPVNGVLGFAELLARQPLPEPAMRIVRRLVQAGKTLGVIINDIFDLALLEVRRLRLDPRSFDPRETITAAVTIASAAAPQKGLKVRVSIHNPLPAQVHGDPSRLQQIIINLVGNGIKFTENGGIDVVIDIVRMTDDTVELMIEVADTGIGIASEVLPRLFQPFSQAEAGRSRRYEGTGLGLAITRALVETMGGAISVESRVGEGSVFRVRLPFRLESGVEAAPMGELPSRILVVDDVALNRDVMADLLRAEGCGVRTAASAAEAMRMLEAESFDVVLMDIRMPDVDGLAASQAIRAGTGPRRYAGPIIGLTANPSPTDRPLYALRGIDGILEKPVDADRLRAVLGHVPAEEAWPEAPVPARLDHLRRTLGPDRAQRILAAFREVSEEAVEAIADRCSRLDFPGVAEGAHRLAGAASNIGFDRLSDLATTLESAARQGSPLAISDTALALVESYRQTVGTVDALLAAPPGPVAVQGQGAVQAGLPA